jgi:hypothetical protein
VNYAIRSLRSSANLIVVCLLCDLTVNFYVQPEQICLVCRFSMEIIDCSIRVTVMLFNTSTVIWHQTFYVKICKNPSDSWGRSLPDPLPGLCPWTPLGTSVLRPSGRRPFCKILNTPLRVHMTCRLIVVCSMAQLPCAAILVTELLE